MKNGEWTENDISKKVYERKTLLKNLQLMDVEAVITDNRTSISNNSKKISKLNAKLENAELYKVLGWKAADFDKKIMGIQSF